MPIDSVVPYSFDTSWIMPAYVSSCIQRKSYYPFSPPSLCKLGRFGEGTLKVISHLRPHMFPLISKLIPLSFPKNGACKPLWSREEFDRLNPEFLFQKVLEQYPKQKYGEIVISPPDGGIALACGISKIPLLPVQLTVNVLHHFNRFSEQIENEISEIIVPNCGSDYYDIIVNFDPCHDRESCSNAFMTRFSLKSLPRPYVWFVKKFLKRDGVIYYLENKNKYPRTLIKNNLSLQTLKRSKNTSNEYDSEMGCNPELKTELVKLFPPLRAYSFDFCGQSNVLFDKFKSKKGIVSNYSVMPPLPYCAGSCFHWLPYGDHAIAKRPITEMNRTLRAWRRGGVEHVTYMRDFCQGADVLNVNDLSDSLSIFDSFEIIGDCSEGESFSSESFKNTKKAVDLMFKSNLNNPEVNIAFNKLIEVVRA